MNARNWPLALIGAALFALLPGCIISVGGSTRGAYDSCTSSDVCSGVTVCRAANTTTDMTATMGGLFCTYQGCITASDCPADPSGFATVCVATSTGSSSQCYRACAPGNTCPAGFTCGGPPGMTPFCVANNGTAPTCGNSGQACCGGATCQGGLTCGTNGLCGIPACGGSGQACCGSNVCNTGLSCTTAGCVPCGNITQPCCAGNTCTAAGAACGSDNLCGLAPYSGCSSASIGAACLGGLNGAGAVVPTSCQRPAIANPGPNGFCSAACVASGAECPGSGMVGRTASCYILAGSTSGQCFVDCPGPQSCPVNTVCLMTNTAAGQQVQICMPPAS